MKRITNRAAMFVRLIGSRMSKKNRIGLVGFSAGGQVAARLLSDGGKLTYDAIDEVDRVDHRPDFAVLIYPWNIYDPKQDRLVQGVQVDDRCPPTFLVHTSDDRSSSLGAVLFYMLASRAPFQGVPTIEIWPGLLSESNA